MMSDDLDLMQLASQGQTLARQDDTDYLAVHVVLAWPLGGVPALYCAYQDWPQSHAAKLADKERQIIELGEALERWAAETLAQTQRASAAEARIKELEALASTQAPPGETPAKNQAGMFGAQAAYISGDSDPGACPDCGKEGWKSARALQMHQQRAHQGMLAFGGKPKQFVEELGWRCAAKGCAGAHARDLHDPLFCTLHAARQITNDVEVTR